MNEKDNKKSKKKIKIIIGISIVIFLLLILVSFGIYETKIKEKKITKEQINEELNNIDTSLKQWDEVKEYTQTAEELNEKRLDIIEAIEEVQKLEYGENYKKQYEQIKKQYVKLQSDTDAVLKDYEKMAIEEIESINNNPCSFHGVFLKEEGNGLQNTDDTLYERYTYYKKINDEYLRNINSGKQSIALDGEQYDISFSYYKDEINEVCVLQPQNNKYFKLEDLEQTRFILGLEIYEINKIQDDEIDILLKIEASYASGAKQNLIKAHLILDEKGGQLIDYNVIDYKVRVNEPNLYILKEDFGYYVVFFYNRTRGEENTIIDQITTIDKYDNDLNLLSTIDFPIPVPENYEYGVEEGKEFNSEDYLIYSNNIFDYYITYSFYTDQNPVYKHYQIDSDLNLIKEEEITTEAFEANRKKDIITQKQYMKVLE